MFFYSPGPDLVPRCRVLQDEGLQDEGGEDVEYDDDCGDVEGEEEEAGPAASGGQNVALSDNVPLQRI